MKKRKPLTLRERVEKWRKDNREKYLAHRKVFIAKRNGTLVPQPCVVCKKQDAEAHHDDYRKPLRVRWLCKYHHTEHHSKLRLSTGAH